MRSFSYLNTAKQVIGSYDGNIPLASWMKHFFKGEKKYGSTDRKQINNLCYCYYRLGNAFAGIGTEERFLIAIFLCSDSGNIILKEQRPEWNDQVQLPLEKKLDLLSAPNEAGNIFPFKQDISTQIDVTIFSKSFLKQPDIFLRIRPGKNGKVMQQLHQAGIHFQIEKNNCLRLLNQTKIDEVLNLDEDAVIQDLNSQRTTESLHHFIPLTSNSTPSVFDCCAASGGKSILVYDQFPKIKLTVSDIRESIIINLRKRFNRAGIHHFNSFVTDISAGDFKPKNNYDIVICDVPCTGSGTWSRTPEQMHFFTGEKLDYYSTLQRKIAINAMKTVKPGGYFLYITCSVFSRENELVTDAISKSTSFKILHSAYLKGYEIKADTLYVALLKNE